MLRRLDLMGQWRCLDKAFWPDRVPLGYRTVVYGHNGSGKSTLSELLLSLAEGYGAADVVWEDERGQRTIVRAGGHSPSPFMAVFTRKWVDENLSAFLDGQNASAIVTLGQEAIHAKEEEERLEVEIAALRNELTEANNKRKAADQKVEKLAREVQEAIVSQLQAFDYKHFTKNRYSISKVKEDLRRYNGDYPHSADHAEALRRLGEEAPSVLPEVTAPKLDAACTEIGRLTEVLSETPSRVALASLEGNAAAQTWVEQGIALHEGADDCLFCAGRVSEERRRQLAHHFDESWLHIRGRAQALLNTVTRARTDLENWLNSIPDAARLTRDLQAMYEDAVGRTRVEVEQRTAILSEVETALRAKAQDPSAALEAPNVSALADALSITVLARSIAEHNDQARSHGEFLARHKETVLDHLVGSQSTTFRGLERQAADAQAKSETSAKSVAVAEKQLNQIRQEQFTTKDMADTLTRDLARVYGKNHLSVAVTDDGKSYSCRRGGEPATDLSDGERTTLSLLYFLRKLEDEQVRSGDPSERIVVVDDPSSSLDREALFATHQWLIDTLRGFGQYVILTHDFSLLRLFINSQRNAWGKSMKRIRDGNPGEIRFPKVSFLEMFAVNVDGGRGVKVGQLPQLLINNTSEYAYLFSMVMAGVADTEDHERLFLLPNAARRVLEVFASYKAPHRTNFDQQLESLIQALDGEPYRDVYDFCNRHSHGDGSESVDVLDARAVHGQIRRCMKFLRAVDNEHFERMCKATGIEPGVLF
ncbi:hypothetical protein MSIMFB_01953 [Mycobacterium simulans]|uniref:Protein CR006 P-loop domain-containing protein n=1 Tax=Mycobacterium simulans TaxID=627089 RepID=A0A7Z7N9B0_9MYCO|nr:AAA family ATPase [Mycobacterium simulans]SOJ54459.1 hypothetical protein MSIMFB_01953 [Mycobacterium simulans]